eukprot:6197768-Pleurochrysis_carterae.AAC.2
MVRKQARARGAGRAYGLTLGRGHPGDVCHGRYGDSRTWGAERERSASTHAMRMRTGKPCM